MHGIASAFLTIQGATITCFTLTEELIAQNEKGDVEIIVPKEESCPKHVIDERKVEEAIERMYRSEQQDMFDDPDMNWSGLR